MVDPASVLVVLVLLGIVLGFRHWLGGAPLFSFEGLFGTAAGRDWPRRVQETDTPHYAVAHLDGLTPGTPTALTPVLRDDPEEPRPEVVDLGSRRAGSTR